MQLQKRAWALAACGIGATSMFTYYYRRNQSTNDPNIVVIGGGIMGSWSTHLLSQAISQQTNKKYPYNVTLIDASHPIRGSWGDSRALHAAIDCDLRVKLNKLNLNEYLKLQKQSESSGSNIRLIKKIGRIYWGPKSSMENMFNVMQSNNIPVKFVESENDEQLNQKLKGVQIRSAKTGWPNFKTLYTDFGYALKANNILEFLRQTATNLASIYPSVNVYDDHKVINIDRDNKIITMQSTFDENNVTQIPYDKLLITSGPWTNLIISCIQPALPLAPIIVSNEQTVDFGFKSAGSYEQMPIVTFSDGSYMSSGGDHWYMVPSCHDFIDSIQENVDRTIKVGYHRQGDLMVNDEFQISGQGLDEFTENISHLRKELNAKQSYDVNTYILDKAKQMVSKRFSEIDPENVKFYMRCLYQNTPDKEFIVGYPKGTNDKNILIACGFNGGGFQQAPMIARFCIHSLLQDIYPHFVMDCLKVEQQESSFGGSDLKFATLFETMQQRFDPSRRSLSKYYSAT